MKIINKKTKEIVDLCEGWLGDVGCGECIVVKPVAVFNKEYRYDSWDDFVNEWEEYKPEEYWYIDSEGVIQKDDNEIIREIRKKIGNCFFSKKEAEKVVDGLEAIEKLEERGVKYTGIDLATNEDDSRKLDVQVHFEVNKKFELDLDQKDLHIIDKFFMTLTNKKGNE